jgi:hypothetical protein
VFDEDDNEESNPYNDSESEQQVLPNKQKS